VVVVGEVVDIGLLVVVIVGAAEVVVHFVTVASTPTHTL
jgi:hypothetical protein